MKHLLAWVLAQRIAVGVIAALGLIMGMWVLRSAPLEVFPDFLPATVTVQTEAPGFDVDQVEQLVTRPVEAALNGSIGLDTIRSDSIPGLSVVTMTFAKGTDPSRARQAVTENLTNALAALPPGIGPPKASPLTSATMDVLKIGLVSDRMSPRDLRDFATVVLKPALLAVPGVARLNIFGGDSAEVQISLDPARMTALGIGVDAAYSASQRALTVQAGGFVETDAQRFAVQLPLPSKLAAIAATAVETRDGQTIRLSDIATVALGAAPAFGDTLVQGRDGVLLTLSAQYGANTLAVTRLLDARIAAFAPRLAAAGIKVYPAMHRPATFVETALGNLRTSLLLGALFVAAVLLLFLHDWRSALISFVSIPLSLVAAALAIWAMGYSIDTLVLGGFAVALGVLVDDAIVDVENILRRLREAGEKSFTERLDIILRASVEIRKAMVYATVVVVLVFIPMLLQSGVQGAFLKPLALAFILSVTASLGVALTVTPALAALLLTRQSQRPAPAWTLRIEAVQGRCILWLGQSRKAALVIVASVFILLSGLTSLRPVEFLPMFREGHLVAGVNFIQPGVSLATAKTMGRAISAALLKLPFIATVEQQIGRAEAGEDTWPVDEAEFHIELKHDQSIDQEAAQESVRQTLASFPGIETEVLTFLGDRLSEGLTGETAQIVVALYGEDLDNLANAANAAEAAIHKVPGAVDIAGSAGNNVPALGVNIDFQAAAGLGLDPGLAPQLVRAATQGLAVGNVYIGAQSLPAVLRIDVPDSGIGAGLTDLLITSPVAGIVPLSRFTTLVPAQARATIRHDGGRRYGTVGFNVQGRSVTDTITDARRAVSNAHLPASIDVVFGGVGNAARDAAIGLGMAAGAALLCIVLALRGAFADRRNVALVLLNLPFSLIGALAALLLFNLPLTLGAGVGLITVFGISARNAILLLSHYDDLRMGKPLIEATAITGARHRFVPIVMTALVAALGLLPLAVGLGQAGHEIEAPLAIVVLGGLASSTVLSLLLLPALAWHEK